KVNLEKIGARRRLGDEILEERFHADRDFFSRRQLRLHGAKLRKGDGAGRRRIKNESEIVCAAPVGKFGVDQRSQAADLEANAVNHAANCSRKTAWRTENPAAARSQFLPL